MSLGAGPDGVSSDVAALRSLLEECSISFVLRVVV